MFLSRTKCLTLKSTVRRFRECALLFLLLPSLLLARPFIVLVYNVENLFDADGMALFRDYQPAHYTRQHILTKLENIAQLVSQFEGGRGPDIILLQEIEVDQSNGEEVPDYMAVLQRYAHTTIRDMLGDEFDEAVADLPAEVLLLKAMADKGMSGYNVVRGEAIQAESTRVLAQKNVTFTRFPVRRVVSHPTINARAILEVEVDVDGARLYLFNNHWKSGAGSPMTELTRMANAQTLRTRLDEILAGDPNADIIVGGDFNSHYNQGQRYPQMKRTGLNDVLGSQGDELDLRSSLGALYNLWFELPPKERASDAYQGEWGTLMQILITRGLYDYRGVQYVDNSFAVAKIRGLNVSDTGLPYRWSFEGSGGSGYSDHFPVYAKFITVKEGDSGRYIELDKPSRGEEGAAQVNKVDFSAVDVERVALRLEALSGAVALRDDALKGRIVRVIGKRRGRGRLSVVINHEVFEVWVPDKRLRDQLRAQWKEGEWIHFYGELGQYRGRWQFVIRAPSWVK